MPNAERVYAALDTARAHREVVRAEALAEYTPSHVPTRGSDVEAWIKQYRDSERIGSDAWHEIDALLDDYRDHADTGTPLDRDVSYPGES